MFRDEAWDIVLLILVLGIVLPMSLKLTLPILRETREIRYEEISTKTVVKQQNEQEQAYDTFNGGYSYSEMINLLSKQSYFMPTPRVLYIGGKALKVESEAPKPNKPGDKDTPGEAYTDTAAQFIPNNVNTMITIKNDMKEWCQAYNGLHGNGTGQKLTFTCKFDTMKKTGPADDAYSVQVLGIKKQPNGEMKKTSFRCEAGGLLDNFNAATDKILKAE